MQCNKIIGIIVRIILIRLFEYNKYKLNDVLIGISGVPIKWHDGN